MSSAEKLRNLPAVDEVLRSPQLSEEFLSQPRPQLVEWIRNAIARCRGELLNGKDLTSDEALRYVIEETGRQQRQENGRCQQAVINATGILLHTNLGRAPMADSAISRMRESSGYANVEMNLTSGKRSGRGERACRLLQQLAGAEDAVVVNNCAAATMLVLQAVASGREVIVSRGQLVEIGGGYRLPEVFAASGATLKEVGTTNRTYLRDYENAISEQTGAIIRVHRSNFYQGGFVTEPDIADLVALGKERNVPVIDDLGSGCMTDLSQYGLQEPTVPGSVQAGADLTLFSGDKLFGGPQAGIIVGTSEFVEPLRRNPMMRALRVDKVTLAALAATAEIHLSGRATEELPLLQMMSRSAELIHETAQRVHGEIRVPPGAQLQVVECISEVGGGSVPGSSIPGYGLQLTGTDSELMAKLLRSEAPAVLGRISDDTVILDLRTVAADQIPTLIVRLQAALDSAGVPS